MKYLTLCLLLLSSTALADAVVTVTAPSAGGPVDSYELFVDAVLVGPVVVGPNTFPNLVDTAGTFTFRVDAINAFGRTQSDPVVVVALTPGKPGLTVVITQAP